jgi:hypothetical protein
MESRSPAQITDVADVERLSIDDDAFLDIVGVLSFFVGSIRVSKLDVYFCSEIRAVLSTFKRID